MQVDHIALFHVENGTHRLPFDFARLVVTLPNPLTRFALIDFVIALLCRRLDVHKFLIGAFAFTVVHD